MRGPRSARSAAAALPLALAAACFGGSAPLHFYTLAAADGVGEAPIASRPDLGLSVGPIEIPRYLDRPELVTREHAHGLLPWNEHRWGGSLRTDIEDAVAHDLAALLGTLRVAVYPAEARFPVQYRVLIDFLAFEGERGKSVSLRARWILASGADGRALAVEDARFEEPAASPAWEDLVAAQRAALARLDREIAARIAELASGT